MEQATKTIDHTPMAAKAKECADSILLHSKERMLRVKGPFEPAHKAYMALALAAAYQSASRPNLTAVALKKCGYQRG